jgi:hypothetical protein
MSKTTSVQIVLSSLNKKAKPLQNKLSSLQVKDQKDYDLAGSLMKQLKTLAKESEAEKKKIIDPLNQTLKAIKEHFKPFEEVVEALEADTKKKMIAFYTAQEEKQKKLEAKFERGEIKKVSTLVSKQDELQVSSAHSSVRKTKVVEIVDEKKIPREYLVPDMAAIKEALNAGKKVAGCVLSDKTGIAI